MAQGGKQEKAGHVLVSSGIPRSSIAASIAFSSLCHLGVPTLHTQHAALHRAYAIEACRMQAALYRAYDEGVDDERTVTHIGYASPASYMPLYACC